MGNLLTMTREYPLLTATRERPVQQQRHSTAKNKQMNKIIKKRKLPENALLNNHIVFLINLL